MKNLYTDYIKAVPSNTQYAEEQSKPLDRILCAIRTSSQKHGSEKQKDLMSPLLNAIVRKPCNWNKYQCARCFESLLKEYIVGEDLELLLAVSGYAEGYTRIMTASKRRDKYAETHLEEYGIVSNKALIKREEVALLGMATLMSDEYVIEPNKLIRVVANAIGIDELRELGLSELICFIEDHSNSDRTFNKKIELDGWGDNSTDDNCYSHRTTYTMSAITAGVLGERDVVFNSIFDDANDERKFVSACKTTLADSILAPEWNNDSIEVEDGEIYTIRIFVHNNNLNGYHAVAEETKIKFMIPDTISNEHEIRGYIQSSNAIPSQCWSSVTLKSLTNVFSLNYVEGSCVLKNGVTRSNGCELKKFQDNKYVEIGYKYLDGEFPGGRQYACYVSIKVRVKFEVACSVKTTQRVRNNPDRSWYRTTEAEINDLIDCQFFYRNTSDSLHRDVMVRYVLPDNMEYIPNSTWVYTSNYQNGVQLTKDTVTTSGINIGDYKPQGNAYVRFVVKVIDRNLSKGTTCLMNWGAATVEGKVAKDNAQLYVEK